MQSENKKLGIIGILISMCGTFALAMSSFEYLGEVVRSFDGKEYHPLLLDRTASQISIFIIIFGFGIQLLEKVWDKIPSKYQKISEFIIIFFPLLLIVYLLFYEITIRFL